MVQSGARSVTDNTGGVVMARYLAERAAGQIDADPAQAQAVNRLVALEGRLCGYEPRPAPLPTVRRGLFGRKLSPLPRTKTTNTPQGLYIHGGVGRGKSMLMDLFYDTVLVFKKRRVHFNAFMLECHTRIQQWRDAPRSAIEGDDPIRPLAWRIAQEAWLLCFDEFNVVDIADAMILARLFEALDDYGVVVLATSNWVPDDLYLDGLQRVLFLPFIAWMKERYEVLHLDSPRDYRRDRLAGHRVYFYPDDRAARIAMSDLFAELTDGAVGVPAQLAVGGRTLPVPHAARGTAWFSFHELCGPRSNRGAADYLALAAHYHTVFLDGIPQLSDDRRDETKRLQLLIDSLYEVRARLVAAAAVPPDALLVKGKMHYEFQRTISRLIEMQAEDYVRGRDAA
jgi:cell division protein ZapE